MLLNAVSRTVPQARSSSLNFIGTETQKVANWLAWGHIQQPQAVLCSHLPSYPRLTLPPISPPQLHSVQTARPTNPPTEAPFGQGPPCTHPALESSPPASSPDTPRGPGYLCRCWVVAVVARWCWGPLGRSLASARIPLQPSAVGGHHLSQAEQTGEGGLPHVFSQASGPNRHHAGTRWRLLNPPPPTSQERTLRFRELHTLNQTDLTAIQDKGSK